MKWCVIGAGGIADRRTIPAIISDEGSELVAVMDRNYAVAEKLGKKYGVKYYSDEDMMLSENVCDAVYIGTPVSCHKAQALTALKYGVHVFVEKPITISKSDAEELLNAFKVANKALVVGYMMRYHNLHQKAERMISCGDIGKPVDVRAQFSCWYPDIKEAWRQNKTLGGGGAIMDLGVHLIELIEYILSDEIENVKSFYSTNVFSYEVEDSGVVLFKTKKGVLGHIDVNFNIPDAASESKLEIYGTEGYVRLNGTIGQEEVGTLSYLYAPIENYSAIQSRSIKKPKKYNGAKGDLYLKQIVGFRTMIESGALTYENAEKAVHVQNIVERIYADDEK